MIWSLLKILAFLAVATALAFAAGWILETPGEIRIAFGTREFYLSPIGFLVSLLVLVIAAILLLKLLGLLGAFIRFLMGDETAMSRYFSRGRERRGFDALADGMVALASGDAKAAARNAAKAEKLLHRPDLTRLLSAQAAEIAGDREKAFGQYKAMLANDRTRFLGIEGLMRQKLAEGDTETALELARKGFALRPDNERMLRTLFDLQSKQGDWGGARATLNATMHARLLPRDIGTRRDAVLSLADAETAFATGDSARGTAAALQANKLAPTFIPAAALAARSLVAQNQKRKAAKALVAAWAANPHPDLAAAFAAIEPDESPAERRRRFQALIAANPDHAESKLLAAELALAAEDFPGARKALGALPETEPTTRSLALMAAIERGQGAPDAVVRGWLAKALHASRGPQWMCAKCNHIHPSWEPVCENCGAFDTLDWRVPPHTENSGVAESSLLPLVIVGAEAEAPAAPVPQEPGPAVEDAVLASAADQARAAG